MPVSCQSQYQKAQVQSLLAFKASGNGEGLGSWVDGTDPCAGWAGVTCGVQGSGGQACNVVITLDLSGTAVTGDVGSLAALTQLTFLALYSTAVSGDVGALAALTQLTTLALPGTAVTGCPLRLANGGSCDCPGSVTCVQPDTPLVRPVPVPVPVGPVVPPATVCAQLTADAANVMFDGKPICTLPECSKKGVTLACDKFPVSIEIPHATKITDTFSFTAVLDLCPGAGKPSR